MSTLLDLARPELRGIRPYVPGAYEPGCIRLNANESPWRAPGDASERGLNVYPPPRPTVLQEKLAEYYGIEQRQILVTRGSSEAIDVLIRGFCAAGRDKTSGGRAIVVEPASLKVRRVRPADARPLIPIETQPAQAVEDPRDHVLRRPLDVGVLDAQDERAAVPAHVEPVEERRPRAADVQIAGGTRREADSDSHAARI